MVVNAPYRFLWGTATSAYQVEGGIKNDWSVWENAGRFDKKGRRIRCGQAVDHWNRYREDFRLLKALGLNAYRLSVEWSRIEPKMDGWDQQALDRYAMMVTYLRELGVRPMVTLHHFTHPVWFGSQSPWWTDASVERFTRFAGKVVEALWMFF